ncbi:hypothetical protein OTK49_03415 [Vibrio coralliirubri]|uniref:hypothetical protein n=1 Tax=Vibrio coralliirubri TaxID=1516159 RepID=UPI002285313E|nr:hypothetical protein [Vibrio coralliirubri]MCY9861566.1 hypothetical protein [Vibrio coralliirubri]
MKNLYNVDNYEQIGKVLDQAIFVFSYKYDDDYSRSILSIQDFIIFGKDGSEIALQSRHPEVINNGTMLTLSIATDYSDIDFDRCSLDLCHLENIDHIEMALEFEEPVKAVLLIGAETYPVTFK